MREGYPTKHEDQDKPKQCIARNPRFTSVHRCVYCGALLQRDDATEEEMITGVFVCKSCGRSGHLNTVVVDMCL